MISKSISLTLHLAIAISIKAYVRKTKQTCNGKGFVTKT